MPKIHVIPAGNQHRSRHQHMQAQIKQGQNDVRYFATEARRQQGLLGAHVASQSTYDAAHRNLENAQQKLASFNQQLAAIGANLNADPSGPVERNPSYLNAKAQRDEAAQQLDHTIVRAPFSGIVTNVPSIAPSVPSASKSGSATLINTPRRTGKRNISQHRASSVWRKHSASRHIRTNPSSGSVLIIALRPLFEIGCHLYRGTLGVLVIVSVKSLVWIVALDKSWWTYGKSGRFVKRQRSTGRY
jgi:hypothetical protein